MSRTHTLPTILATLSLVLAGCKAKDQEESKESAREQTAASPDPAKPATAPVAEPMALEEEAMDEGAKLDDAIGYGRAEAKSGKKNRAKGELDRNAPGGGLGGGGEQGPAPRAWFPETFLFSPLVVTDGSGTANVEVKVPDRLTTWRVLGLAHSRAGSQAGAATTFEGTLPAYVDPVVPSFLRAGDTVRIPIQLVNNTDASMSTSLSVQVEGGTLSVASSQQVAVAKHSSTVRYVEVSAPRAGNLRLMARMGDTDMVVRDIEVQPTGKAIEQIQSGTLAAPREFSIVGAQTVGASPGLARLSVFPGALALLRSELGASVHRGGMAADAFALLLAGKAPELLEKLGDKADPKALRTLTITSTQKVIKHARVLDIGSATLIAEAARSHADNPVLERLGQRALATIESTQAPDGTCGGSDGWTLQRLLVSTADCARAAHDIPNVTIRAKGAFERHAKEISDPFTAAAILAAKAATGELKTALETQVLEAIEDRDNGSKVLAIPEGVVRTDGQAPSQVEATALAILALQDVPDAPLADLGATILARYSPHWGWGDGRANLLCMEAAVRLFDDPLPKVIAITLSKDGEVVAEGSLERDKVRDVLQLRASDLEIAGAHDWQVSASPAVPGLGFSLSLTSWVPWVAEESLGTELQIELPKTMTVGNAVAVSVQALAPSGMPFAIRLELPAGVQVDTASLDAMVQGGSLSRYEHADGQLSLHANPLEPAKRFAGTLRVIPTLRGTLQGGPSSIRISGQEARLPPQVWTVR